MGAVLSSLALASTVIGTGMTAVGQIQQGRVAGQAAQVTANLAIMQGQEASIAAEYNAAVARANAEAIQASAAMDIERQKKAAKALRGMQVARYAKAGVKLEGSPLLVIIDSAAEAELDMAITRYNAETSASQAEFAAREYARGGKAAVSLAETQATQQRAIGKYYIGQGYRAGIGTLLTTAAGFYQPSKKV